MTRSRVRYCKLCTVLRSKQCAGIADRTSLIVSDFGGTCFSSSGVGLACPRAMAGKAGAGRKRNVAGGKATAHALAATGDVKSMGWALAK